MNLFSRSPTCVECGEVLPKEARFCPQCARPASDVYARCPKEGCDGTVTQVDAFCSRCGMELPRADREVKFDLLWDPPRGEIARRFQVDTEKQAVEGSVTVRFGHNALLLGDGSLLKVLGPGIHPIQTTFRDLHVGAGGARNLEVIYFDTSEYTLDYSFADIASKDGLPCLAEARFVVEVREPQRLLANAMKNVETVTHEGLRLRVRREVRNAFEEALGQWPADELAGTRGRKDELDGIVGSHMRRTMEGLGFALVRVEVLDAHAPALQDVHAERARRGTQHYMEKEAVARIEQEAEIHEQKAAAWARLRHSVQQAEMDEVSDKASLRDFLRRMNKEGAEKDLISESELDEITAALAYKKEDREKARQFVMLRLEEEQGYELERLAAKRQLARLDVEIDAARKAAEAAKARAAGDVDIQDMREELAARTEKRRRMFHLDVVEREVEVEEGREDRKAAREREKLRLKIEAYERMKRSKAEGAATKLKAAGEAGLQADQLAALFAEEQPRLAESLTAAFAGRGAEERAELERRHATELRQIFEASQQRDTATMASLIDRLSGAMGAAVSERATAGDREAHATRETVGLMQGASKAPARKRCRTCHCEWMGDSAKCPQCGEAVG